MGRRHCYPGVHNLSRYRGLHSSGRNSTVWTADDETVQFVPSGITWYSGATIIGYGDSIVVTPGLPPPTPPK